MRTTRLIVSALLLVLLVSTIACGGGGDEATPTPSPPLPTPTVTPVPPKPGEWSALADFGEFAFTVNPSGTGITKISFLFSEFKCGPATLSGEVSVENPSLWTIADGQFTANVDLMPNEITIRGKFDETGSQASGTWEVNASGTICMGAWECRPIPTPFSMEVIPDRIEPAVPGQRCVFLVVVADEGESSSKGEPVNISATAPGATVAVDPQVATSGLVAEVTVIPDENTLGKTLSVTIRTERDGLQHTETVDIVMWDGPLPEGILEGALEGAAGKRDVFVPWLAANHPELGITAETEWTATYAKVLMPVANYYLFFSEEWEMGLVFHVMIPPDDWAYIYLRHRFTEVRPSYAFEISSLAAHEEPRALDPRDAPQYLDMSEVWR